MKTTLRILKWILYVILVPVSYVLIALLLSYIPVQRAEQSALLDQTIYLNTNGVHLDVIIPMHQMDSTLLSGLKYDTADRFLSFGWGDENFYINTPNWSDLTFPNAFKAMFLKSPTLMHVTRHRKLREAWREIKVSSTELSKLASYVQTSFALDPEGKKIILADQGYTSSDEFYKAVGSYSCIKTCNSWLNTGFKRSGLRASLWTPFDFGLMNKYE